MYCLDVRCLCVCVSVKIQNLSVSPSKFGVSVKVQMSTDSSIGKSQGRRAVVLYLGRFTAICLVALTDFFSHFSSPKSFASSSVVPPSNCVPSEGTKCQEKYQLGRESLASVA